MKNLKGSLLLLLTAAIWGSSFVFQAEGMEFVKPFTFNALRSLIGGLVLLPVALITNKKSGKKAAGKKYDLWIAGILCGVVLSFGTTLQQIGIARGTTPGKAGFISALYIIIIPLIQIVIGKMPKLKNLFCVIPAVLGMYFLCMTPGDISLSSGDTFVLISTLFFSFHILIIDYFSPKVNGVAMSCLQFLVCGIICSYLMFTYDKPELDNVLKAATPILYTGVFSCGIAYTLQIIGQKYASPLLSSIVLSLESVFAAIFGWIILSQAMNTREICGALLMFFATTLSLLPDNLFSFLKKRK